ncbi:hypothetical protein MAR_023349 [Mya arenaria]|uniref:Uncharacterized protein n=1 Tax=Mya arenaria TaxID=6604 RepID=A0ABY7DQV7_MYAAR|nr:hypothetical protein MAR_023349 [Mya arenaria]
MHFYKMADSLQLTTASLTIETASLTIEVASSFQTVSLTIVRQRAFNYGNIFISDGEPSIMTACLCGSCPGRMRSQLVNRPAKTKKCHQHKPTSNLNLTRGISGTLQRGF